MQKDSAQKLIKQTLQSSFNKEQFIYLTKNLLNHIEGASFNYKGNYIFDDFKDSIQSVERIGKYKDPEDKLIDILIVRLKKEVSLERARTRQRNFVAKYLKGSRGGVLKDAALVAFVSPNEDDWRFSLVKMEYKFNEKGKVEEEFTPARRYSFLVGKNENSHTAQSCLISLLINDEISPTLSELENVFSVEKVTKEFFEKYHEIFLKLKDSLDKIVKKDVKIEKDFKAKNIDTVDFAKKLLGQIVFLYFLQKKGWFGVPRGKDWGEGDKQFLRHLFEKAQQKEKNYFNKILEPLFYEALRLERPKDYYDQFDCRISFLNGGLFDPINDYDWQDTDIEISNEIFSNDLKTKEGDIGSGVLDIFDRYNFTVKEDEPLEKEVAVDPEMLGKVFENLLEVKDRKSKGTYYTPREIVHYMCQESLINYIATATKIDKEKITKLMHFDHFMAQKLTKKKKAEAIAMWEGEVKDINKALNEIRIVDPACGSGAFLVGMMQEIIRLRKIISLFFKIKDTSYYELKLNIIQNNLYGVDIDLGAVEIAKLRLWLSLIVDEEDIKQIRPLPNLDYKIVQGNSLLSVEKEKKGMGNMFYEQAMNELKEKKALYFNETNTNKKQLYKKHIDDIISKITNGHKDFDFEIYFSEVFHEKKGFDVVIANPPYINVNDMKEEATLYRNLFTTSFGSYDIYVLFFERSVDILKEKGVLTYITSNKYFIADYAKKLRQFLLDNTKLLTLLDLADCKRVFEHAFVSPAITILQKEKAKDYKFKLGLLQDEDVYNLDSINLSLVSIGDLAQGQNSTFDIYSEEETKSIFKKLNAGSMPLSEFADVRTGIMGFEYWKMEPFIKEGRKAGSIRIITNGQIDKYSFLFGNKINLYKKNFHNPYLDIEKAPLNENTKRLFQTKKIIIRGVAKRLAAQFDDKGFGVLVAVHTAIPKTTEYDIFYLLALINSSLFDWYHLRKFYTARIPMGSLKYPISFLKQLPIKSISSSEQKPFVNLVDKILIITKSPDYPNNTAKQAKVREYEKQIDQLVYKLYGLTEKEISIIESDN